MKRTLLCAPPVWFLAAAVLTAPGCKRTPPGGEHKPPDVTVTRAAEREVTDTVEFPARTAAVEAVEIRAQVTGYLEAIHFKPGDPVKKGQLLFEIDRKSYQADYDKADSQVTVQQVKMKRLEEDVKRNAPLVGMGVSRQDFDKMIGDRDEAVAGLQAAKANREGFKVSLDRTWVRSPIDGKIGRALVTVGNLVRTDTTVLANIVSTGRMYAYFDVDEKTLLNYQRDVREGKIKEGKADEGAARLTLSDGTVLQGGTVEADVQLNRGTGTIEVRATFPDPDGVLKAGLIGRIVLPAGEPHKALVVPEVAVGSDQGLKYVYVVDDQNKVEYRKVTAGNVSDGMQVIEQGLKAGEWVIVKGLLRVRDGITVNPERQ